MEAATFILKYVVAMVEIRSCDPFMEDLILADSFQINIELSTTICNLYFIDISGFGTSIKQDSRGLRQYIVDLSYPSLGQSHRFLDNFEKRFFLT